jgi:hypothetical protein
MTSVDILSLVLVREGKGRSRAGHCNGIGMAIH